MARHDALIAEKQRVLQLRYALRLGVRVEAEAQKPEAEAQKPEAEAHLPEAEAQEPEADA